MGRAGADQTGGELVEVGLADHDGACRGEPRHLGDVLRRADAGHDILALGVQQELAIELLGAGGGIAGEQYAGGGVVTGIAEHHLHHVDGSTQIGRNVVGLAIDIGPRVEPGLEDRIDGLA